jgi:hypothetical protein
MALSQ